MASTFRGEGGKGSIKLVHHQNAVIFVFFNLYFLEYSVFTDSSFFLSSIQSQRSASCGLGSASFKLNLSSKTEKHN